MFDIQSVTDVGDGKFEPGEKIRMTVQATNDAGAPVAISSLSRLEIILSGPSTNPQILNYQRAAQNFFSGTGPQTFNMPGQYFYEPIGTSDGSLNLFATDNAPIWNVTNAATTLLRRTGTGASTALAAGANVAQNYIDVVSSTGIVKDNYLVIDDAVGAVREYMKVQWVQGNRIWFGSQYRTTYKPALRIAHAIGATVDVVTTASVSASSYSVDATTGVITETSEIGAGELIASYTADYVIPSVYPGALGDSPTNGEDWGDWTGLSLVDGTYVLDVHGARSLTVTRSGENTTYTEGADSTAAHLLFGNATDEEIVSRIDPQACYGCHNSLQFHGGSRRSVEACLSCHGTAGAESLPLYENQTTGSFGSPVEFRYLLHNLHNGVFPGMPGGVQDCAKCHGDNTAWQLPDERLHPNQSVPTRAWRAACSSCHSDSPALAHIDANTSLAGAEACAVCHGADDTLSVTNVHKIK